MDSNDTPSPAQGFPTAFSRTLAFLILRFWLGGAALASGLNKFGQSEKIFEENPETGEMTASVIRNYAFDFYKGVPAKEFERLLGDALLPECVLQVFYYALGPALILSGACLLIGCMTRSALFVIGLIFAALTFGLSLIDSSGSAGTLGIYTLAVVAALLLSDNNRLCISKKF